MTNISDKSDHKRRVNPRTIRTIPAITATIVLLTAITACGGEGTDTQPAGTGNGATPVAGQAAEQSRPNDAGQNGTSQSAPESRAATTQTTSDTTKPDDPPQATTPAAANRAMQPTPGQPSMPSEATPAGENGTGTVATGADAEQAQSDYQRAEMYLRIERYQRALTILDGVIELNPQMAEAYTLRGFARTMTGDHEGALQDLDAAIEMNADNRSRAFSFRSLANSQQGNYPQALQDAQQALEVQSESAQEIERKDASLAKIVAQYRSGDYGSIDRYAAENQDSANYYDEETRQQPYGLVEIYMHRNLAHELNMLNEANTTLLLDPTNIQALFARARAHETFRWYEMATTDLSAGVEALPVDQRESTYRHRAETWAKAGRYDEILANLEGAPPGGSLDGDTLVALAHWHEGDLAAALERISAMDYGDPVAMFDLSDDASSLNLHTSANRANTHLALKGALKAAHGDLEEGLKYLYMTACGERLKHAEDDSIPEQMRGHRNTDRPMREITDRLKNSWFRDRGYGQEWSRAEEARATWEWCDYPTEFTSNPEAGLFATVAMQYTSENVYPPRPQQQIYRIEANLIDPIIIDSDNPALLHYMAAWFHNGINWGTNSDTLRDIVLSLALGNENADAHRIKAEAHLTMATRQHPFLVLEREEEIQWREEQYQEAVKAYSTYESMSTPRRFEAARYHFARGKVLHIIKQKDAATKAFQLAFENGYDEGKVREALMQLNR